ncbi:hypothetical protein ACFVU2_10655 [Leifsonia sp. NPDC058194]|uniref:hypothetical protein n=1 Tax=Leifsonia sp. NPDC058194 TaxID=3346374 RepID=UPI0036DA5D6B
MTERNADSPLLASKPRTPAPIRAAVNLIGVVGLFLAPIGMCAVALLRFFASAYTISYGTRQEAHDAAVAAFGWIAAAGVLVVLSAVAIAVLRLTVRARFVDGTVWTAVGALMVLVAIGLWRLSGFWIDQYPA